ncbi:all trans-polyprenyl-diphosphate synthase PDSS1-like [Gigantopelta aegis]|uniref:all trans-polyprenyl-diphosphate synthase PDSS1-like n=1 Tax=Gigantopelta aegis TaxID=1735272 RepID=UPI001B887ABB|nr:all trans-polyprenyl-diphosphate synthase PDSS1-like [Gigantopelta aegis]
MAAAAAVRSRLHWTATYCCHGVPKRNLVTQRRVVRVNTNSPHQNNFGCCQTQVRGQHSSCQFNNYSSNGTFVHFQRHFHRSKQIHAISNHPLIVGLVFHYHEPIRLHQPCHQPVRLLFQCHHLIRSLSSHVTKSDEKNLDPYKLVELELQSLSREIKKEITTSYDSLSQIASYYFDGKGKGFRPMVIMLVARACNMHEQLSEVLLYSQKRVAMIAEIIHTASLVHDDVIDASDTRRNKPSINCIWGQRKAILVGDYILSVSSIILARLRNTEVVSILSQVIDDLVRGEFMQLGSKEDEDERFAHYLKKTFKKTASLLANSCKATAVLGKCSEEVVEIAYQYGRNIGIAFQLMDDLLDFTSSDAVMGKPTSADLKLGLATAPVLFAAQTYPELHVMIMRRFSYDGDVQKARYYVAQSDGVAQTRFLATQHAKEAVRLLKLLKPSDSQLALISLAEMVLKRTK